MSEEDSRDSIIPPPSLPAQPQGGLDFSRLVESFFNLQSQEIATRQQEIKLREKEVENAHEFSIKSLEAQTADYEKEREHDRATQRYRLYFATVVIVILATFLTIALIRNKDQMAIEIVKLIIYVGAGGLGGAAYMYRKLQSSGGNSNK